jgi:hypothetical protein
MQAIIRILYAVLWFMAAIFAPVPPDGGPWESDR